MDLSHHFLNDQLVDDLLMFLQRCQDESFCFFRFSRVKLRILDAVFDSLRLDVTKQLVVSGESAGPR